LGFNPNYYTGVLEGSNRKIVYEYSWEQKAGSVKINGNKKGEN
jgi:hypothetical protein